MKFFFSSIVTSLFSFLFIVFFFGNKILNYLYSFDAIYSPLEAKRSNCRKSNNHMKIIRKYYIKGDIYFNEAGNKKIFDILKNYDFGAPDRSRTHNLRSRNPALYPVEATGAI
jgi:hypothetical protein